MSMTLHDVLAGIKPTDGMVFGFAGTGVART